MLLAEWLFKHCGWENHVAQAKNLEQNEDARIINETNGGFELATASV